MNTIHACCVLIGDKGFLIRGESGSGKSRLSRLLVEEALRQKRFGRLVADDRVHVAAHHGRLIARPVPPLKGLIEVRGLGIVPMQAEPSALIQGLIDLVYNDVPRMPDERDQKAEILGIEVGRIALRVQEPDLSLVFAWIDGQKSTVF